MHVKTQLMISRTGQPDHRFPPSGNRINGSTTVEAETSFHAALDALPDKWYLSNIGPAINVLDRTYVDVYAEVLDPDDERRYDMGLPGYATITPEDGWGPSETLVPGQPLYASIVTEIGDAPLAMGEVPAELSELGVAECTFNAYSLPADVETIAAMARWLDSRTKAMWAEKGETATW